MFRLEVNLLFFLFVFVSLLLLVVVTVNKVASRTKTKAGTAGRRCWKSWGFLSRAVERADRGAPRRGPVTVTFHHKHRAVWFLNPTILVQWNNTPQISHNKPRMLCDFIFSLLSANRAEHDVFWAAGSCQLLLDWLVTGGTRRPETPSCQSRTLTSSFVALVLFKSGRHP